MTLSSQSKILCIIPAKKKSKRLKNKNILLYKKKPLIFHTIEAAIKSNLFSKIIISTNSKKILTLCEKYQKKVLLEKRPEFLAGTKATLNDVCYHILKKYLKHSISFDYVSILYATAPKRNFRDIRNTFYLLKKNKKFTSSMAVTELKKSIFNAGYLKKNKINFLFPNVVNQSQKNKLYVDNGSTYFCKTDFFLKKKKIITDSCAGYVMSEKKSIDINYYDDYKKLLKYK